MSEDLFEQVKLFLPKYLTPTQKSDLFAELSKFPDNFNFYFNPQDDDPLQGDGWRGLVAINFTTLEKRELSGVVLSNSCDISPANSREVDVQVLFAPLMKLSAFGEVLRGAGKDVAQVDSTLYDVRRQRLTSIFYLPALSGVVEESIILLDDVHGHPLDDFLGCDRQRLFSLNQYAFYLFLMKLSIHFCRFQEGFARLAG